MSTSFMIERIYILKARGQSQEESFTASIGAMLSSWTSVSLALREELLEPSLAWTSQLQQR